MGLNFKKELVLGETQLFPPTSSITPTRLQDRLISKLGKNAFPFHLEFPVHSPTSVTLQPGLEVIILIHRIEPSSVPPKL